MNWSLRKMLGVVLLAVVLITSFSPLAAADDKKGIEKLFTEKSYNFYDIALNCSRLIAHYYETDQLDSVHAVLDYWTDESGKWSVITQVKVLLAIDEGKFDDSMITADLIQDLMYFRSAVMYSRQVHRGGRSILDPAFDTVMQRVAYRLYAREEPGSQEALICQFYSGDIDFLFPALQSDTYKATPLGQTYAKYARKQSRHQFQYVAFSAGTWVPTGKRTSLGTHPSAGMQVGIDFQGYSVQLDFSGSFLKASNKYVFNDKGTSDTTDHFGLLYFGLDLGKQLMRTYRNELLLQLGIAGQSLIVKASSDKDKAREIASAAFAAGLSYRYYFKPYGGVFLGVEPRFELSKMNTNGGSDLSGSAFSIRIVLGLGDIDYNRRGDILKALQYKY